MRMSREGLVSLPDSQMLVLPLDVAQPESGAAYIITREACKRLDDGTLPMRVKADDWYHFFRDGMLDRVRCVIPMPVAKTPSFTSTMDYYSRTSWKARLLAIITRYDA